MIGILIKRSGSRSNNTKAHQSSLRNVGSTRSSGHAVLTCCLLVWLAFLSGSITGCSSAATGNYDHPTQRPYSINNQVYYPIPSSYGFNQSGIASWYGPHFHGRPTSSGEIYDMHGMTAAHKTLPMNTMLLVKNLENDREIVVRVNDRGPFVQGRIIDLTHTGAQKLGILGNGTARVQIVALGEVGKNEQQIREQASHFYEGEYFVQIGSFTNPNNAARLQNRFLKAGHQTQVQKYQDGDDIFYRVQVFVGRHLQAAEQARIILEKRGYRNAFVIAN